MLKILNDVEEHTNPDDVITWLRFSSEVSCGAEGFQLNPVEYSAGQDAFCSLQGTDFKRLSIVKRGLQPISDCSLQDGGNSSVLYTVLYIPPQGFMFLLSLALLLPLFSPPLGLSMQQFTSVIQRQKQTLQYNSQVLRYRGTSHLA